MKATGRTILPGRGYQYVILPGRGYQYDILIASTRQYCGVRSEPFMSTKEEPSTKQALSLVYHEHRGITLPHAQMA